MAIFKKAKCKTPGCNRWQTKLKKKIRDANGKTKQVKNVCSRCGGDLYEDQNYTIQWTGEDGRKRTLTLGPNKEDAKTVLGDMVNAVRKAQYLPKPRDGKQKFSDVADEYFNAHGFEKKDPKRIETAIRHFKAFFGNRTLAEIDHKLVQDYKKFRLGQTVLGDKLGKELTKEGTPFKRKKPPRKIARSTVGREISVLKAIFAYAIDQKYIHNEDDPTRKTKVDQSRTMVRYLTKKQREKLFACLTPGTRPFFRFMSLTGWRYGEIANLTWEDLKGFASTAYLADTKTSKAEGDHQPRFLPAKALELAEAQPRISEYVFSNPKTKTKWGSLHASFRRAAIKAGLVYKDGSVFRPHDLRHDFLSWGGMAGLNTNTLKALGGHADSRSTDRYVHLDTDYLNEAYQTLEAKRFKRDRDKKKRRETEATYK